MTALLNLNTLASLLNGIDGVALTAIDTLLKVTMVLTIAGLATLALGRASAALRHLVWTLALTSALLLPVLSLALPRWQLPVIKLASQQQVVMPSTNSVSTAMPEPPALSSARQPSRDMVRRDAPTPPTATVTAPSTTASSSTAAPSAPVAWMTVLLTIWAIGAALVLARLLVGLAAVRWMSGRTAWVIDAPWLPLAVELASDLGISHRLRFRESARATMPMACGLVKPIVLMPADASGWPVERLRIVLLHELAHVKRRDCLTHVVVQVACALYWFNPLAWVAARHIRTERERACDDLVLASGTRGPDYAEELLEIARVMRAGRFPALMTGATLAMAHRSQLEGRLIAILDPKVPRSGVSRLRAVLGMAMVACALPPLATLQAWTFEERTDARSTTEASATPTVAVAEPQPEPRPQPEPEPQDNVATVSARAAAESAKAQTHRPLVEVDAEAIAHSVAESMAHSTSQIESHVQSQVQSQVQSHVQSMVQPMITGWGPGAGVGVGQEGKPADPRMIAALTAALKDTDKDVRETAMHALIQLRDPSIYEPLVQALKDASADVREQAVHGLSQLRDKRSYEPLSGMLKDPNADVREAAVHALGQLRDPRAVDALIAAMKDENPGVREQAAFGLGQLRDRRATVALAASIKDTNPDVRQQAVFALGQLRDASAIEGLTTALHDEKADVREQAAFALGQIREPRAVQPLISALKDAAPDVRQQAAFALGQIRDRSAVEALVIALKDSNADVREQVAFALGQIRDPRAIEGLTEALKDQNASVRQQAAFALGQLAR
jgi:HEAT repeat protein/beta-lactamase regulating signal transducer with metallopeptidase domain